MYVGQTLKTNIHCMQFKTPLYMYNAIQKADMHFVLSNRSCLDVLHCYSVFRLLVKI